LSYPWVLDLMGVGLGSFLYPWVESAHEPHRTGFGWRFCFSPTGVSEPGKYLKNPKGTKKTSKGTQTKHEKNPKPEKNPDENPKKFRRNSFIKPDGHPKPDGFRFRCQFSPCQI
jgi:hypothetical protein